MSQYLAIKNWGQFQSSRRHFDWIKDYPAQVSDEDYCKLTFFQRHVLQELRRLRGRVGKNIPYDLHYICRETAATVPDKPRINAALTRLLHDGWLILTDQQVENEQTPQIKKENEKESKTKPSAHEVRGSKPIDARFQDCVDILHRYWNRFIKGKVRFEVWMDLAGYKQLKNSLRRSEALTVEDFTRCVANRARSPSVDHCEPAYKWLGHVTEWAGGPKNGRGTSKAEQRVADVAATTNAVFNGSGEVSGDAATGLPNTTSGRGTGDLAGNTQKLLVRGTAAGGGLSGG